MITKRWESMFSVVNGVISLIVIVFLITASSSYVTREECEKMQGRLFQRLERVEGLMNRIIDSKNQPPSASKTIQNNFFRA